MPDDFETRAREILQGEDPRLLAELLALRAATQGFAAQRWPGLPHSADVLNARNRHLLDQAARLLGPERFERLFGFAPNEVINLVDPTIRPIEP